MFSQFIKVVYSYFFNGLTLIRMHHVGKNIFIRRGLSSQNPSSITLGDEVRIGKNCRLDCFGNDGHVGVIHLGKGCSLNHYSTILAGGDVLIGDYSRFASFVTIMAESHGINPENGIYHKQPLVCKPVNIGEYCWIGEKAIIMPGVSIGDWSIVGAGSLVTRDIPAYSIAVGNPAKVIKHYNFETHAWEKV